MIETMKVAKDFKRIKHMIIYRILNKINSKQYIGQTTQTLESRINEHFHNKRNHPLYCAIRRYGTQNFEFSLVDTASNMDELNEKEKYYIKFYDCLWPNGYNFHQGGRNHYQDLETKKKISVGLMGREPWCKGLTKETDSRVAQQAEKMCIVMLGKNKGNHNCGRGKRSPMSAKHKENLILARSGTKLVNGHYVRI